VSQRLILKIVFIKKQVPKGFICPLSGKTMRDPVTTADGHSYERVWIQARFLAQQKNGSPCPCSPLTNAPLPNYDLIPNHALKKSIEDFAKYKNRMKEQERLEKEESMPVMTTATVVGEKKKKCFSKLDAGTRFENRIS